MPRKTPEELGLRELGGGTALAEAEEARPRRSPEELGLRELRPPARRKFPEELGIRELMPATEAVPVSVPSRQQLFTQAAPQMAPQAGPSVEPQVQPVAPRPMQPKGPKDVGPIATPQQAQWHKFNKTLQPQSIERLRLEHEVNVAREREAGQQGIFNTPSAPTPVGPVTSAASEVFRGAVSSGLSLPVRGLIDPTVRAITGKDPELGKQLEAGSEFLFPVDPQQTKTFLGGTLPKAVGSMAAFAGPGLAAKTVAGGTRLAMTLGAAAGIGQGYEEATEAGVSTEKIVGSMVANGLLGATEALPINGWLKRVDGVLGGQLAQKFAKYAGRPVAEGLAGAIEEGLQEIGQQFGSNVTARLLYDADRELGAGVTEGGAAGGIIGFVMSALGARFGRGRQREPIVQPEGRKPILLPASSQEPMVQMEGEAGVEPRVNVEAEPIRPQVPEWFEPLPEAPRVNVPRGTLQRQAPERIAPVEPKVQMPEGQRLLPAVGPQPSPPQIVVPRGEPVPNRPGVYDIGPGMGGRSYNVVFPNGEQTTVTISPKKGKPTLEGRVIEEYGKRGLEAPAEFVPEPGPTEEVAPIPQAGRPEPIVQPVQREVLAEPQVQIPRKALPPAEPHIEELVKAKEAAEEQRDIARREVEVDEWTGLGSKKAFHRALPAAEADTATEIASIDLANLKARNDLESPKAGDNEIRAMADAASQAAEELGIPPRLFTPKGDELYAFGPKGKMQEFVDRTVELYGKRQIPDSQYENYLRGGVGNTAAAADQAMGAVKAGEKGAKFREVTKTVEPKVSVPAKAEANKEVEDWFKQVELRMKQEAIGQEMLNDLEDIGKGPKDVVEQFWRGTYDKLPAEGKKLIERHIRATTSFKPGDTIGTTKEGANIVAKTWEETYPSTAAVSDIEYLEGTERGLIALMEMANRKVGKAVTEQGGLFEVKEAEMPDFEIPQGWEDIPAEPGAKPYFKVHYKSEPGAVADTLYLSKPMADFWAQIWPRRPFIGFAADASQRKDIAHYLEVANSPGASKAFLQEVTEYLRSTGQPLTTKNVNDTAGTLQRGLLSVENYLKAYPDRALIVASVQPGITQARLQQTLSHEFGHIYHARVTGKTAANVVDAKFLEHPLVDRVRNSGKLSGYTDFNLRTEIPTRIGAGQLDTLGYTLDEAVEVWGHFFDLAFEKHGNNAYQVVGGMEPPMREAIREAFAKAAGGIDVTKTKTGERPTKGFPLVPEGREGGLEKDAGIHFEREEPKAGKLSDKDEILLRSSFLFGAEKPAGKALTQAVRGLRGIIENLRTWPVGGEAAARTPVAERLESRFNAAAKRAQTLADTFNSTNEKFKIAYEQTERISEKGTIEKEDRPRFRKGTQPVRAETEEFRFSEKDIERAGADLVGLMRELKDAERAFETASDPESAAKVGAARKATEDAVKRWQVYRSAAGRAVQTFNRPIPLDIIQGLREAGMLIDGVKQRLPLDENIVRSAANWDKLTTTEKLQVGKDIVNSFRLNLFSVSSWTLDFIGNAAELGAQTGEALGRDLFQTVKGNPTIPSLRGMVRALRVGSEGLLTGTKTGRKIVSKIAGAQPLRRLVGRQAELPQTVRERLGTSVAGEILPAEGVFWSRTSKTGSIYDFMKGAPLYAKGLVDTTAKRIGALSTIYREANIEARRRGLTGLDRQQFIHEYSENPPEDVMKLAIENGRKAGFDRELSRIEEKIADSTAARLLLDVFARWPFQFSRWGAEMLGYNPGLLKRMFRAARGKEPSPDARLLDDIAGYIFKSAAGIYGLYLLNKIYNKVDFNSMESVDDDGNRVRLSNRDPAPTGLWFLSVLKGDMAKAGGALRHASIPFARLLSGEGGLVGGIVQSYLRAAQNPTGDPRELRRFLEDQINRAIPGQAILSALKTAFDPTIREGVGANLPGVSLTKPAVINPATGEPLRPRQRVMGVEMPSIGGVPIPGATRLLDPVTKLLNRYGLQVYRGPRTPVAGYPAGSVPDKLRREWQQEFGMARNQLLMPLAGMDWPSDEVARKKISTLDAQAARMATTTISMLYGKQEKPERKPTVRELRRPQMYQEPKVQPVERQSRQEPKVQPAR